MSGQMSGVVVSVESARQGVIATGWVGTEMSVWNAADIDRDGCDLTPDDGVTVFHATGEVAEGVSDDDPDVVTMADSAPADWPAGGTDADGQSIPTDTRLDLWPEVLDVVAQVDTGDDDLLPVSVPHALRPLLSEGLRDEGGGEQVICEARGTGWVIVDVIGRRGEVGLDGLAPAVIESIEAAAASGVRRWDSINEPDSDGHSAGDLWFQHDTALTGKTIGQWHWDGTVWVKDQYADAVLANIDAGKIVGGTLSGLAGIYSPDPSSLPRTQIVGSTISVLRAGAEGEEVPTVQLGGAADDQLMISDVGGSPLGGIDPDGNLLAQDANVNGDLTVGGVALPDMLSPMAQGVIARQSLGSSATTNSWKFNNNELGTVEIIFTEQESRLYRIVFNGLMNLSGPGRGYTRFRYNDVTGVNSPPDPPTLTTTQLASHTVNAYASGAYPVHLEAFIVGSDNMACRVGVSGQTGAANLVGYFVSNDNYRSELYVEDCGTYTLRGDGGVNNMGGTPYSGSTSGGTGSSVKQTYTKSWNVAATRVWRGGSVQSGNLMQGSYGGLARYGMWLWDGSIASDVGSAASVKSMFLTIRNIDFPMNVGGNGTVYLDTANNTSLPASPQTAAGNRFSVAMKGGQALRIGVPGDRWGNFASGVSRGFWLGPGVGGSGSAYGHFSPAASITMTYTK